MRRLSWVVGLVVALTVGLTSQVIQMVIPGGPTLPAACSVRNAFFKTGVNVGLYVCTATNTWLGPLGTGGSGSAPSDATYITQTANGSLTAEQALGALATGILKSTTTTGVVSIAVAGTDYLSPTGSGAGLTNLPWASLTGVPAPVTALSGTNTGDQNLWASFIVSGQTTLTTASPTQALTIVAGSNITLTTDNTAKSLTITAAGTGAPTDAEYWVGAANGSLSAEKNLGALSTALVLNTAGTPSAYAGTSCTNQFPRSLNGSGVATCASVALDADVANDLPYANLTQAGAASRLLGRGSAAGAGDWQDISLGSGLSMSGTTLSATATAQTYPLTLTIDGGGSVLTTGMKGCTIAPMAGTIISATLLSTDGSVTSGSLVVDVWEDTLNNYPPTDADSITASAPPTLSSATNSFDTTLTGWSTTLVNGDSTSTISVVCYNVDSATSITRAQLILVVQP